MTGALVAFVIAVLVPLFVATWRTSLLGLFAQGALLAWMALEQRASSGGDMALTLFDLLVVRGLAAPAALWLTLRAAGAPARNDVIAPNLLSWALALALFVAAFRAADALVPSEGVAQMRVGVAASAFTIGLFVLATSRGVVSQTIGLFRVDDAVALFELGAAHEEPLGLRAARTLVTLGAVALCRWYVLHLSRPPGDEGPMAEGASL